MYQNNGPEDHPIADLACFVPEESLRDERGWPSAHKLTGVHTHFAHSPAGNARACLVKAVEHASENIDEREVD